MPITSFLYYGIIIFKLRGMEVFICYGLDDFYFTLRFQCLSRIFFSIVIVYNMFIINYLLLKFSSQSQRIFFHHSLHQLIRACKLVNFHIRHIALCLLSNHFHFEVFLDHSMQSATTPRLSPDSSYCQPALSTGSWHNEDVQQLLVNK